MTKVTKSTDALMAEVRQLLAEDASEERVDQRGTRKAAFKKQIAAQREATARRFASAENEIFASGVEATLGLVPFVGDFVAKTLITSGSDFREESLNALAPLLMANSGFWPLLALTGGKPGTFLEDVIDAAGEVETALRPGQDTITGVLSKADRGKAADNNKLAGDADTAATEAQEQVEDAKEFYSESRDMRKQVLENARSIEAERRESISSINDI